MAAAFLVSSGQCGVYVYYVYVAKCILVMEDRRVGHHVSPTLIEPDNHSTEMKKRQIAISSSSERDKGTLPKDTPCSESATCEGKDTNRTNPRSESPVQRDS
ncbi:hypothetical protein M9458_056353 [Cirrhinus mrigala]|uniref:Uncharacterized protein n=1 Tax=Cirrhinus mrigala TaxID=683832 RepID=A0ABD0MDK7_CIRMR